MASESLLNNYYNRGGYNQPSRIGFMMKMIRNLKPLTQEEWEIWYLENVHDEEYLDGLAQEMCDFIPDQYHVSVYSSRNELIGIQLKPETFYMGRYQYKVDIRGKMNAFCRDKNARAFILKYSVASDRSGIIFTNPEVINEIQTYL